MRQEKLHTDDHRHRYQKRHDQAHGEIDRAEPPRRLRIGGPHHAVIDAEDQHQCNFGDEQDAEEERESAQRFLAAFFEAHVIDAVEQNPKRKKKRRHDERNDDRVDAHPAVDDIGDVRTEDDERRVGDVDDVEHPERDRDADAQGRVETAEQQPGDDGVEHQRRREFHRDKNGAVGILTAPFRPYFLLSWYGAFTVPVA